MTQFVSEQAASPEQTQTDAERYCTSVRLVNRTAGDCRANGEAPELVQVAAAERAVACWRTDELVLRGI